MLQVRMDSKVRTVFGKGPMRQLRMSEITPANLYSGGTPPVSLQFETPKLYKNLLFIHGRNAVITLKVEGDNVDERHVLVQEIQKDPTTGHLLHVDFLEIDLQKTGKFIVPIEYVGTAKGVDLGGELHVYKNVVHLRGCPLDIPDVIRVDITPLEQGGPGLTFGDLPLPANVEMLEKPGVTCVAVQ
ncbi:50S ribosomal protein L25 [Desulfobulbus elongatus]|uniref:50S ribosomal protein L25 n=1 Tax=Desulfobulbus elongatus TaxID=53332 RepID=UPI000485EBAC|nr:50S ribosomal protein L25 [Desulfobulbus elongatus]